MVFNPEERKILENLIISKVGVLTEVSQAYKERKSKGHLIAEPIEVKVRLCEWELNILGRLLQKIS